MRMRDRLREVRIAGPNGAPIPLVAEERQLYVSRRSAELQQTPNLLPRYGAIGLAVGVVIAGLGLLAYAAWRAPFAIVATTWAVATGVSGLLLLFLWLGTHHLFAYRNMNLLQLSPAAVALAVAAPLSLYRPRARAVASWLALLLVASSLLGLVLKVVPGVAQANLAVIALVLPGHLALAWAVRRLAHAQAGDRAAAAAPSPGVAPGSAPRRATAP